MEENEVTPEVKEEVLPTEPVETVEEVKARLDNAKAENARKSQEIQRLREEADARSVKESAQVFNPQDLNTWKDHELKACLKDPQYVALHDQADELLTKRRMKRFQNEEQESALRMNTELERQKKYPETLDPSHPMAIKMAEIMNQYRLLHNPAGRLIAAELASSQLKQAKAVAAGRKQEQERQAAITANFEGGTRPAPKGSDKVNVEELKKKAMEGDKAAQIEWFKHRGLIQ